jgi:lipoate-protein ligase B
MRALPTSSSTIHCLWLGRMPYADALSLQESIVDQHAALGDTLLLLEHDPVYTTGRGGRPENLPRRAPDDKPEIPVLRVGRGGDVTYHGPGQLVGYPLVDLRARGGDVHRFLRDLEAAIVASLAVFGVCAGCSPGRTGVWVRERKIASIGIGVRRGITLHGFALNVVDDLAPFQAIVPCGLAGVRMTSLETELGKPAPGIEHVAEVVGLHVTRALARTPHVGAGAEP